MKIQIQTTLEHGIFFLEDSREGGEIPADTGAAPVTFTDSCICFWVTHYVDGDANIVVSQSAYSDSIAPSFSGSIECASKIVALHDVSGNECHLLGLKDDFARIKIWQFGETNRDASWVQVENLKLW